MVDISSVMLECEYSGHARDELNCLTWLLVAAVFDVAYAGAADPLMFGVERHWLARPAINREGIDDHCVGR